VNSPEKIARLMVENCIYLMRENMNLMQQTPLITEEMEINIRQRIMNEVAIVPINASIISIQCSGLETEIKEKTRQLFYSYLADEIHEEFYEIINHRGNQYFGIIKEYQEEISENNWGNCLKALSFKLFQFCLGGGEEDDPIIISDAFEEIIYIELGIDLWIKALKGASGILGSDTLNDCNEDF
jgi:hypothetical protein